MPVSTYQITNHEAMHRPNASPHTPLHDGMNDL